MKTGKNLRISGIIVIVLTLFLQAGCTKRWVRDAISDGIVDGLRKSRREKPAPKAHTPAPKESHAKAGHDVHWSYEGTTGPDHWGEFFPECGTGRSQSPLDIKGPFKKTSAPIAVHYHESVLRMLNNGHTIQVNYDPGSSITIDHKTYNLLQFHFHRPSEEKINGKSKAMVVHLVHKSEEGQLAVIGVLLEEGNENPLIETLWDALPKDEGHEEVSPKIRINVSELLPHHRGYYHYMGSLTTPPCTEGVAFYIMQETMPVSKRQVKAFPFKMNARPVQPQNGRVLSEFAP